MIGQLLNTRYEITAPIGKGAMGAVYRATDIQTRQEVAVKVISGDLAVDPEMLERFKREGEALRKLRHPNIVGFLDAFQHEERHVIVMEYVPGGSLYELLKQGPLPIERARQIALDLCDALIRAHRLNIIHRDIKPENILIDEDGTPKLADFGVARLAEGTRMTRSGMQVGTPYYMAPEAWKGETLDGQADVWSLGVVLFEMLAGQVPFDGDTGHAVMTKVFSTQSPDLKKLRTETPSALVKIVSRMLTRDKKRRYQTMRQVGVDLESGQLSGTPKPAKPGVLLPKFSLPVARIKSLALILILLIGGYFAYRPLASLIDISVNETAVSTTDSTPTLPSTNGVNQTMISPKDGMVLVFVPSGTFTMGSENITSDEQPEHNVRLDAYWIDQTEVTNAMYMKCVEDGGCAPPAFSGSNTRSLYFGNPEFNEYPVIQVNWHQALAYCSWAGRRLPTEAEWEKAARGTIGNDYPWGDQSPTSGSDISNFNNIIGDTTRVGSYPLGISRFDAYDMAGNVSEWVSSLFRPYPYDADDGREDADDIDFRVIRGGSWNLNFGFIRSALRGYLNPTVSNKNVGFRCAQSP